MLVYDRSVCVLYRITEYLELDLLTLLQKASLAEIKPNRLILMVTMTWPPKMHCPTDLLMHELVYQVYNVVLATAVVPGVYQA